MKNLREKNGFSLVELLIAVTILAMITGGIYLTLATGQSTWFTTDTNIHLQENLRKSLDRLTSELRQTRVAQQQIFNGTGANGSDVLRFSLPIICEAGNNLIDANGDVAFWGAPLTWGCTDAACMDADNDCTTLEYQFIEYRLNNNEQLLRRVLGGGLNVVREEVFAGAITDFQAQINGAVISLTVTAQEATTMNRVMSEQKSMDVYLRN